MSQRDEFDDASARAILERAADLDASGEATLSLADLEDAARDAGIDAAHVRAAALELREGLLGEGDPRSALTFGATIPRRLSDASMRAVVELAEQAFGGSGVTEHRGDRISWQSNGFQQRYVHVSLVRHEDETRLRVDESKSGPRTSAAMAFAGWFTLVSVATAFGVALGAATLSALGWLGLNVLAGVSIGRAYRKRIAARDRSGRAFVATASGVGEARRERRAAIAPERDSAETQAQEVEAEAVAPALARR